MRGKERATDEYIFGSARIRALENSLIGTERTERLLEAGNVERCVSLLTEYGVDPVRNPETGAFLREETLLGRTRKVYGELFECAPDAEFLRIWLCPYDCNNIKAAIKCVRRGVSCEGLTFDFGSIPCEEVLDAARKNDFSKLPEPFGTAGAEASDAFSRTSNPQWVDLILDRACYRAMLSMAQRSGVEYAVRLVRRKIDLINLLTCVRLLRMKSGEAGKSMMIEAMLEGGTLEQSTLTEWYDAGETVLWEKLAFSDYRRFAQAAGGAEATLTQVETAADNDWMDLIREARMIPYGPEALIGYLLASEYETRNLRILLAGFGAQIPSHVIRERIRNSYV